MTERSALALACLLRVAAQDAAGPPPPASCGAWFDGPRAGDPDAICVGGREGAEAKWMLELMGTGAALIDVEHDGDLDLFLVAGRVPGDPEDASSDRLYRNRGDGTFEDVTEAAGVSDSAYGMGVAAGDFDGDGFEDLFVANWGPDRLLRNRGDGTFEDVTAKAGVGDAGWSTSAAFGDPDGDGDLDLYVCRYFTHDAAAPPNGGEPCPFLDLLVPCGPQWLPAERDLYWRNEGDGTFTERSREAGMQDVRPSYGLGVTFCDVDADGRLDVFVGNDSLPNFVFKNRGDGTFEEIGAISGLSASIDGREQACMGIDVADFDGDLREDFVVTNFSADYNTIYRNQGDGFFDDVTQLVGLRDAAWWTLGWGTRFFDADCDGDLDLFVANGHVYPTIDGRSGIDYAEPNHLYLQEAGRFRLVSEQAGPGMALVKPSRGAAFGDLDGDGWIDVVVCERNGPPSILRARPGPGVHRALVELLPGEGRRPIDHAVVVVRAGGRAMMRRVNRGGSYASANDPRLHFGLGASESIDELEVRWPDGSRASFRGIPADRLVTIRHGSDRIELKDLR